MNAPQSAQEAPVEAVTEEVADVATGTPDDVGVALEDVMGDPSVEELTVQPAPGDAAAPVGAQEIDAGATAVDPAVTVEAPELPTQRDDGKWTMGKYVADDLPGLVVLVNEGRRNAEKLVGKKLDELGEYVAENGNPFTKGDDENLEDEGEEDFNADDPFEPGDFENSIAAGVADQLAQRFNLAPPAEQQVPQGVDPVQLQLMQQQVYQQANSVVNSDEATPAHFREVLTNLVLYAPDDKDSRDAVLQEWANRPGQQVAALQETMEIDRAFAQHAIEQQNLAQLQAAQAQFDAEQQNEQGIEAVQQAEAEAFTTARDAFALRNPDWQQYSAGMNGYLGNNRALMARAKGDPEAIYSVLDTALQIARATTQPAPVAGQQPGASEQRSNMGNVNVTPQITPEAAAAAQAVHDQQVDWATLETGASVDGPIDVTVTKPHLATDEVPLDDVIGIPLVR